MQIDHHHWLRENYFKIIAASWLAFGQQSIMAQDGVTLVAFLSLYLRGFGVQALLHIGQAYAMTLTVIGASFSCILI